MYPIDVIGIGMGRQDLTPFHMELIHHCDLLAGGGRHLAMFPEFAGETFTITGDLPELYRTLRASLPTRRTVVLASGDPLFFGIGSTLVKQFASDQIRIHSNISSLSSAFSRLGLPWQDAKIVSLHHRAETPLDFRPLALEDKLFFLTAPGRGPAFIARHLRNKPGADFHLCVLENLGHPDLEKITWFSDLDDLETSGFTDPNVVVLVRKSQPRSQGGTNVSHETHLGMPDTWFAHVDGLITKAEIRALCISKLRLNRTDHLLWDVGAGSGSVGIEAAALLPGGQVMAFEKNPLRSKHIHENLDRFGIDNLTIHPLAFPGGIEKDLASPDRIFIGGGGKNLPQIITSAVGCLQSGGVLVVNTVVIDSLAAAIQIMTDLGLSPEIVQAQISRSAPISGSHRLTPLNPVWIISGRKPLKAEST